MSKNSLEATYVQQLQYSFEDWSLVRTPPESGRTTEGAFVLKKHVSDVECATEWQVQIVVSITSSADMRGSYSTVRLEPHDAMVRRINWGAVDMFDLAKGFPIESIPMGDAKLVPHGDITEQGCDEKEVCPMMGGGFVVVGVDHPAIRGRVFQLITQFEVEFVG